MLKFTYSQRGIKRTLPEMMKFIIIIVGNISPNSPSRGYINALLYRKKVNDNYMI